MSNNTIRLVVQTFGLREISGKILERTDNSICFQYKKPRSVLKVNEVFALSSVVAIDDHNLETGTATLLVNTNHVVLDTKVAEYRVIGDWVDIKYADGKTGSFRTSDCQLTEEVNLKTLVGPSNDDTDLLETGNWK